MMSGCGVRGLAGGTKPEGISEKQKQNKNIPLTGLQRRPSHSGMALQKKKAQSLPILFWAQPVVQKRSDGWLEGHCCKKRPTFTGRPFVPAHFASSSLKEAGSFLTTSQTTLLWGGSNSCFTLSSSLLRKTKNAPSLPETAGRDEP